MDENKLHILKPFENYQFENYFVSSFNNSAYQIIKSLLNDNRNELIFINSTIGLGKTHLINAFINKLETKENIYYSNTMLFKRSLVNAIRENQASEFDEYIMNFNVFILENIEDLCNAGVTQKRLIDLLDYFISDNKLVIISASLGEDKLNKCDNKLKSLLLSNVIVNIRTPSFDEKIKFIQHKTKQYQLDFPDDFYKIIAKKTPNDFRIINGIVKSILKQNEIGNGISEEILLNILHTVKYEMFLYED